MTALAALYTDEDMSALVATLLRARGLAVTTVPEQKALGKTDVEHLKFATAMQRCLITHNPEGLARLHLQCIEERKQHYDIMVVPQKNAYEIARRIGILVSALTADEIQNQLL